MFVSVWTFAVENAQAAEPAIELKQAIQKLSKHENYSWVSVRKSAGGDAGTIKGKINKDGLSQVSIKMAGRTVKGVLKGRKGAIQVEDGWKGTDEFTGDGGSPRSNPLTFLARHLSTFGKSPVVQATGLLKKTKQLKNNGEGVYSGKLTDEGVKQNVPRFGVEVSKTEGSVKFWVKDGLLVKYRYTVKAHVKFVRQKREVDYDRTTIVEIHDIATSKLEVPEAALKKLAQSKRS